MRGFTRHDSKSMSTDVNSVPMYACMRTFFPSFWSELTMVSSILVLKHMLKGHNGRKYGSFTSSLLTGFHLNAIVLHAMCKIIMYSTNKWRKKVGVYNTLSKQCEPNCLGGRRTYWGHGMSLDGMWWNCQPSVWFHQAILQIAWMLPSG